MSKIIYLNKLEIARMELDELVRSLARRYKLNYYEIFGIIEVEKDILNKEVKT